MSNSEQKGTCAHLVLGARCSLIPGHSGSHVAIVNSVNLYDPPLAFTPRRTCSFQQHQKRIETMIQEGLHDGMRWKPESQLRYQELEEADWRLIEPVSLGVLDVRKGQYGPDWAKGVSPSVEQPSVVVHLDEPVITSVGVSCSLELWNRINENASQAALDALQRLERIYLLEDFIKGQGLKLPEQHPDKFAASADSTERRAEMPSKDTNCNGPNCYLDTLSSPNHFVIHEPPCEKAAAPVSAETAKEAMPVIPETNLQNDPEVRRLNQLSSQQVSAETPPNLVHFWTGFGNSCMTPDGRKGNAMCTGDRSMVTCPKCLENLRVSAETVMSPDDFYDKFQSENEGLWTQYWPDEWPKIARALMVAYEQYASPIRMAHALEEERAKRKLKLIKWPNEAPPYCPECDGMMYISAGPRDLICLNCHQISEIDRLESELAKLRAEREGGETK